MIKELEKALKAAGDPTRIRILAMLGCGPLCVCQIVEVLGFSQSTVSKHLSILEGAGLVKNERQGKWMFYGLAKPAQPLARRLIAMVKSGTGDDPQTGKDRAKVASDRIQTMLDSCTPKEKGRKEVAQ